jgi:hypothetical protein
VPPLADAYDGGKKINGLKPRLSVDTVGLVLTVIVTAASMQDRDGAFRLLAVLARAVCLRSPWRGPWDEPGTRRLPHVAALRARSE